MTIRVCRSVIVTTLLLTSLIAAGCSGSQRDASIFPVHGMVLVNGKPAKYADVILVPADPELIEEYKAHGKADENGEYYLTTKRFQDGAKAGEYRVGISWRMPANPRSSDDPQEGPELLPPEFQDPKTSGLKVEINTNESELPPIVVNLKS